MAGSFDKCSKAGNASADVAHWLSIYSADAIIVDRKTGIPRTLFVPDPAISVCGGIQPGILTRVLGDEHRENGLAARMLMAYPPRRPKQWTDDEIPQAQETALEELIDGLSALGPNLDGAGNPKPGIVRLSAEARESFIAYFNHTGREQAGLTSDLAASWSKLEETAARFALVFHCVRQVTTEDVDP